MESKVGYTQENISKDGGEDQREDAIEVVSDDIVEAEDIKSNATQYLELDCNIIKEEQGNNTRHLHNCATYNLEKYIKKCLLIFNHKIVEGHKTRHGTEKDVGALRNTFEKFGFQVEVHNDLRRIQVYKELEAFGSRDFTDYGCIIVAVLTHGKENLLRATDKDAYYSEVEILRYLDARENLTLATKPRVLIVQACRGEENTHGICVRSKIETQRDGCDDEGHRFFLPEEADMLVLHSSYLGKPSHRHPVEGSWFIQSFCNKINELASTHDLMSIIVKVQNEVAIDREYQHFNIKTIRYETNKQIPVFQSTLLRLLYLKNYGDAVPEFVLSSDGTRSLVNRMLRESEPNTPLPSNDAFNINLITALFSLTEWIVITETHLESSEHDEEDISRLVAELLKYRRVLDSINLIKSQTYQISDAEISMFEDKVRRQSRRYDAIAAKVQMLSENLYKSRPTADPVPSTSSAGTHGPLSSLYPNLQYTHRSISPVVEINEYGSVSPEPPLRRSSLSCPNLREFILPAPRTVPPETQEPSPPSSELPHEEQMPRTQEKPLKPAINCLVYKSVVRLFRLLSKNKSEKTRNAKHGNGATASQAQSAPATMTHMPSWADLHDRFATRLSDPVLNRPRQMSLSSSVSSLTNISFASSLIRDMIIVEGIEFLYD